MTTPGPTWRVKGPRVVVGLLFAGVLSWYLVLPAVDEVRSSPLVPKVADGLVSIALPRTAEMEPNAVVHYTVQAPGSRIHSTIEITIRKPATRTTSVEVVGMGQPLASVGSCDGPITSQESNVPFARLSSTQRESITNQLTTHHYVDQQVLTPTQITDEASTKTYTVLTLGVDRATMQGDAATVECSLGDPGLLTAASSELALSIPPTSWVVPDESQMDGPDLRVGVTFALNPGVTLVRSVGMTSQGDASKGNSWETGREGSGSRSGGPSSARAPGLGAVFSVAEGTHQKQNTVFFGGIALGLVGSLIIGALATTFDVLEAGQLRRLQHHATPGERVVAQPEPIRSLTQQPAGHRTRARLWLSQIRKKTTAALCQHWRRLRDRL